jgi:hypothetical protein
MHLDDPKEEEGGGGEGKEDEKGSGMDGCRGGREKRPRWGFSFSYASKSGAVYTRSRRIDYGEASALIEP